MPQQNAEVLEILFRQIANNREVNRVVGEVAAGRHDTIVACERRRR
jgi:hypothetical protein